MATKYNRLNYEDRLTIEKGLTNHESFRSIAKKINKAPSSITREVCNHLVEKNTYGFGGNKNRCIHKAKCDVSYVCSYPVASCKLKRCSTCSTVPCNTVCSQFEEEICEKLLKAPYVCNGCEKRSRCRLRKYYYYAGEAHKAATTLRSESRSGISLTEDEIKEIDDIVSPRLKKGQSINHIHASAQDELPVCASTLYKLLHANLLTARPIDAPRIVRMRPRKKSTQLKVDKSCRIGRTMKDLEVYLDEHPDEPILEGDSVIGSKGGKCLLTLTWKSCDFQIGYLRDHNTSASFTKIIDGLYASLGDEKFHKVFPTVWVLDNGAEFSNPAAIEKYGIRVFYCDPGAPNQKGSCENTHEHIRRVLPKGTSFDNLDQNFFYLLFSNINSMKRKKLNNHSAYDVFSSLYGDDIDIFHAFNISEVKPEDVTLNKSLLENYLRSNKII